MSKGIKYGGKDLKDMNAEEMLEAAEAIYSSLETERAKNRAYNELLSGGYPIHSIWRSFANDGLAFTGIILIIIVLLFKH